MGNARHSMLVPLRQPHICIHKEVRALQFTRAFLIAPSPMGSLPLCMEPFGVLGLFLVPGTAGQK